MVKEISKELAEHIFKGGFIHCKDLHDHACWYHGVLKFYDIFKRAPKFYLPLHLIPVLLFKRKKLMQE